jgi:multidrug efflux pump subunit AcrA (membrane-fusion protein)
MNPRVEQAVRHPLAALHELGRAARRAEGPRELEFLAVNDTRQLLPYRQAAIWHTGGGVKALSGVVKPEAHVPYVQWLQRVLSWAAARAPQEPLRLTAPDLPPELASDWDQWWPAHAVWLPVQGLGGWVLARDLPWTDPQVALLAEWVDVWRHAWQSLHPASRGLSWLRGRGTAVPSATAVPRPWWRRPLLLWLLLVGAVAIWPVRLSVLVPGELVPARPAVLRSPMEGVIDVFHVQPNQVVAKDQPLFGFDELLIQSRLEVTRQTLATAQAEYRQTMQQALSDPRSRAQLAILTGRIEEKQAELDYMSDQLKRAQVLSPRDGVVLLDDPSEWIGRPVAVGERILRVAALDDVEVEAWVPLADAIDLADDAPLKLYLSASPLAPVTATVRYMSHEAVQRPDMTYAYRLRAQLDAPTAHRVGQKGTAKLYGQRVPMVYWALRRPLASARAYMGW